MDRTELTLVVAAALLAFLFIGWILGGVFRSLAGSSSGSFRNATDMADRLQRAEDNEARLRAVERDLTAELAEVRRELGDCLRRLDTARAEVDEIRDAYRQAVGPRQTRS